MKTILMQILMLLLVTFNSISQTIPVKIDLVSNGNKLNAFFYPSEKDNPSPAMILLHGYPGNENNPLGLAEGLHSSGINILVFNYQGTFSSEGIFNYENCMNDIEVALDFLKQKNNIRQFAIDTSRIVICGYSHGGSMVLTAAIHNPEIKNIISIAGTDQSVYIKKMASDPNYRIVFEQRIASAFIPKGPIKLDSISLHNYFNTVIINVDDYDLVKNADRLKTRKILFIVGWLDDACLMEENVLPLYRQLKILKAENVNIKAFDTNHNFSNVKYKLINSIVEWTSK